MHWVFSIIPKLNGKCSNLMFGGPDFNVRYVTAGDKVYRRKDKIKGTNAYQPPFKPTAPRL